MFELHSSRAFGDLLASFNQRDLAVDQLGLAGVVLRPINIPANIQVSQTRQPRLDRLLLSIKSRQLAVQAGVHARLFVFNLSQHPLNPVRWKLSQLAYGCGQLGVQLLLAHERLGTLHHLAALGTVVVGMAFLNLGGHSVPALGAAQESREREVILPLPGLGLAAIAHHGLRGVPQLLADGGLVDALVAFAGEVERAVVEGVLEHPLHLRRGQGIAAVATQPQLVHLQAQVKQCVLAGSVKLKQLPEQRES